MAGLGLAGGFGAAGAADALRDLLARRFMEVMTRRQAALDEARLQQQRDIAMRQLSQGDRRIGLDERELGERGRQFDVTAGFKGRELGMEEQAQPLRLRHLGAQTAELERKPTAEQEERAHAERILGLREESEGRLIGLRNKGDLQVANVRAANSAASRPRIQQVIGVNAQGQPVTRIVNLDTQEVLAEFPRGLTPEEQAQQAATLAGARTEGTLKAKEANKPPGTLERIGNVLKSLKGTSAEDESKKRAEELMKKYGGL